MCPFPFTLITFPLQQKSDSPSRAPPAADTYRRLSHLQSRETSYAAAPDDSPYPAKNCGVSVVPSTTILFKLPCKLPHRRQDPANAFDRVQIRMIERVVTRHGRVSRAFVIPRPERSLRMNIPLRNRVHQRRIVLPRRVRSHIAHHDMSQLKVLRLLIRLRRSDHQLRVVADNLIHHNLYLAEFSLRPLCLCRISRGGIRIAMPLTCTVPTCIGFKNSHPDLHER